MATSSQQSSLVNPTNTNEEVEIITFYIKLSSIVRHIPKHNVLIIAEDKLK